MAAQGQTQVASGSDRLPHPSCHQRSRGLIRPEGSNSAGGQQWILSAEGHQPGCGEAALSGAQGRAEATRSF